MAKSAPGRAPENSATLEPLAVPIPIACQLTSLARSSIYREIANGNLIAVKSGKRTLIPMANIKSWLAQLPHISN
jgi:excisionase family DNA binding protein